MSRRLGTVRLDEPLTVFTLVCTAVDGCVVPFTFAYEDQAVSHADWMRQLGYVVVLGTRVITRV